MDTLSVLELAFFAAVIILSYSIRGSAGFGGITVPMLAWIMSLKVIAPMVAFFGLISSLAILRYDLRHVVWRDLWRILPWCAAGVAAGLYFFKTLDARTLAQALGIFVVAYGSWSLWSTFRESREFKLPMNTITPVAGTVAGFVGTIFGSNAGPFFALYLDLLNYGKSAFRATVAAILLGFGIFRVSGYVAVGAYDHDTLIACAAGLPLMALGAFLGNRIHANFEQLVFKRFVALVVILSGIPLILR
jgi:hypothetical protein